MRNIIFIKPLFAMTLVGWLSFIKDSVAVHNPPPRPPFELPPGNGSGSGSCAGEPGGSSGDGTAGSAHGDNDCQGNHGPIPCDMEPYIDRPSLPPHGRPMITALPAAPPTLFPYTPNPPRIDRRPWYCRMLGIGCKDTKCRLFRDYLVNEETGEWIDWEGEDYVLCWKPGEADVPKDIPRSSPYHGGHARKARNTHWNRCRMCRATSRECKERAYRLRDRCIYDKTDYYRNLCQRYKQFRSGNPIPKDSYKCTVDWGCQGEGIISCVETWMKSAPELGVEVEYADEYQMEIKAITPVAEAGGTYASANRTTYSVTWGGEVGAERACYSIGDQAVDDCTAAWSSCEQAAGGCSPGFRDGAP